MQAADGWWMNIKKPPSFLQGTSYFLALLRKHRATQLMESSGCCGNVLSESAQIGRAASSAPTLSSAGCVVEDAARWRVHSLEGSRVCAHAIVLDSILGWRSAVGSWTRVVSVLGEDVHVGGSASTALSYFLTRRWRERDRAADYHVSRAA